MPVTEALTLALWSSSLPPECRLGGRDRLFYRPPDPDQHLGEGNRILLWGTLQEPPTRNYLQLLLCYRWGAGGGST